MPCITRVTATAPASPMATPMAVSFRPSPKTMLLTWPVLSGNGGDVSFIHSAITYETGADERRVECVRCRGLPPPHHQPFFLSDWQRTQQHPIDERKHDGGSGNTYRQCQHGRRSEPFGATQPT